MSDKPEALFLADALEVALDTVISGDVDRRAAAELRRLHKENAELLGALKFWRRSPDFAAALAKAEDKP